MGKYDDIINMPHYRSKKRPAMSMENRAAQFAPFAALTGHGAAIEETARLTDVQIELDENSRQELGHRMAYLFSNLQQHPTVTFTHFVKDDKKAGGAYVMTTGTIKKTDESSNSLTLKDGHTIKLANIIAVDGPLFDDLD